ncbi:MAG: hypothetical protein KDD51_09415 [Bdellovibrionales bacterium]|nr:hypothetical protein [Bdellovibrionales bacterium]
MRTWMVIGIALWAVQASVARAESGARLLAVQHHLSAVVPWAMPKDPDFYAEYVSKEDPAIRWAYIDRWRPHERNIPFHFDTGRSAYYGNQLGASGTNQVDQRGALASYVMRLRLEGLFRNYLSRQDAPATAKRLGHTYSDVRSGITLTGENQMRVRFLYDFQNDLTRLSLERGAFDASLLHLRTLGAVSGAAPLGALSLQLGARLTAKARAYVLYELSSYVFESGLQQELRPGLNGVLRLRSPLGVAGTQVLDAVFSLRF